MAGWPMAMAAGEERSEATYEQARTIVLLLARAIKNENTYISIVSYS